MLHESPAIIIEPPGRGSSEPRRVPRYLPDASAHPKPTQVLSLEKPEEILDYWGESHIWRLKPAEIRKARAHRPSARQPLAAPARVASERVSARSIAVRSSAFPELVICLCGTRGWLV